ncbi:hypothetical protein GCM10027299_38250 [Larkinella ripae]
MTSVVAKKKILLAEDDGDDRDFFVDFLSHRTDIDVLPCVTTGVEVMEYLNASPTPADLPDVIILDQNMPKLTGLETLERIRLNDLLANVVVVVYSTYVGPELIDSCLRAGAALVISKPVSYEGYHAMMDEIIAVCKRISMD